MISHSILIWKIPPYSYSSFCTSSWHNGKLFSMLGLLYYLFWSQYPDKWNVFLISLQIESIHFTHAWLQTKEVIPVVFPIQSV